MIDYIAAYTKTQISHANTNIPRSSITYFHLFSYRREINFNGNADFEIELKCNIKILPIDVISITDADSRGGGED